MTYLLMSYCMTSVKQCITYAVSIDFWGVMVVVVIVMYVSS
jgi:hypothetical protein